MEKDLSSSSYYTINNKKTKGKNLGVALVKKQKSNLNSSTNLDSDLNSNGSWEESRGDIFQQTVKRLNINLEVISNFIEVRDQLFNLLFDRDNKKKVNYKFQIISKFKKIFDSGLDDYVFKVNVFGTVIEFKKDRERIKQLVYDYHYWREKAIKEILKYFDSENSYVVYEFARMANVSHPSEVYDAINDCILIIMDQIKITPYMFLYIKKWVFTQLIRNIKKQRNDNVVLFSCISDEDDRYGEDRIMRNIYRSQDRILAEEIPSYTDFDEIIKVIDESYDEQDLRCVDNKTNEEKMLESMLKGTLVDKLEKIKDF